MTDLAKGRIERFFATAQDRLVKGLRLAGAGTVEQANAYLDGEFLAEWNRRWVVRAANATDAHRPLTEVHQLAASLSHVERRRVNNDYTFQFRGHKYQIARQSIVAGMKGNAVRVEARLDGTMAVRFGSQYVPVSVCAPIAEAVPRDPYKSVGKDQ